MKNKSIAIAAIQNGCQLQGRYLNAATGEACAIGSLALAAGVAKSAIAVGDKYNASIGHPMTGSMERGITKKFGLEAGHLYLIQRKNDRIKNLAKRRKAIISMIETLPEE